MENRKVIIADDEPLVLVGLKSIINWEENGFTIVGTARNGVDLLSLIQSKAPDIVITDVKMPSMSGLDVMQKCSDEGRSLPLFILLSGYEEFEFVKKAISLNAVDYLVKLELTCESLLTSLAKAVARIEEKGLSNQDGALASKSLFNDRFFIRLLNGLFDSRSHYEKQLRLLDIHIARSHVAVASLALWGKEEGSLDELATLYISAENMVREILTHHLECHVIPIDTRHLVAYCFFDDFDKLAIKASFTSCFSLIKRYFSLSCAGTLGVMVDDLYDASLSYDSASRQENLVDGSLVFAQTDSPSPSFDMSVYRKRLSAAFAELDGSVLRQVFIDLASDLESAKPLMLDAISAASTVLSMVLSMVPDAEKLMGQVFDSYNGGYRCIYRAKSIEQCSEYLLAMADGLSTELAKRRLDYRANVVQRVQQYISENLDKHLTLGDVADVFGFSQNYLSSLFNKYGNIGFVEYATKARVEKAKVLMANGNLKIYEIAEQLGFDSAFYFSKVFKKVEGISPRAFLQKHYSLPT